MKRMKHIDKYRPEYPVNYRVKECIHRIFDINNLWDEYDADHFINEATKIIPEVKKGTSVLNRSIAAATIYSTSRLLSRYKKEKIPLLTQPQVAKACSISTFTLRNTLRRLE